MKNLLLILSCMVFIVGCGNTLKNSWLNFRAYYNTYYNAQENFRTGLKKVNQQETTIDPKEPVRIHPAPVQAGNSDFQKAIDKGARLLRKFPNSKWADDALLLIGKSYYYRQEFYPALKKFEELRNATSSPKLKQYSIIWKGRTQLDLKLYSDGISFLESELNRYPADWSAERKAEIQALAAEHHAMFTNWEQSSDYLSAAVSKIEDRKLLGRAQFLYGQVLERQERYGEAYYTFSKVSENFPGFEYVFWARYKQADVARKEGNLDQAMAIYESLRKDDKNFQRRSQLRFEVTRTLEQKGELEEAEKRYKELLYGDQIQQQRTLKADIYYRLGRMYSDQYNNYPVAAAYFDSSSAISEEPKNIEETENPQSLADSFGKYTQLQNTISRADSLMWLGSLSKTQLDSALIRIRAQKRRALLQDRDEESRNTFANRPPTGSIDQESNGTLYGFLNHRNSELVNQSKVDFRIIWGDRPLIDDWRRMEVVRRSSVASNRSRSEQNQAQSGNAIDKTIEMNLDDIPKTPEEKDQLEVEKVNAQYELGNLLFLNLNRPDSARYFFHKVINSSVNGELRPRAMYSLHELYKTTDNQDSLNYWQSRILDEYPTSRYARRIRDDGTSDSSAEPDSTEKLIRKFQSIANSPQKDKATKLRKLALENRSSELAPYIHYQSIENYIAQAKADTNNSDSVQVVTVSADTLHSASKIAQNTTYSGARWDSVRMAVQEFDTTFSNAEQREKVTKLKELLDQQKSSEELASCENLGITLSVKPSLDEFLTTVEYPEKLQETSISGEVRYSFVVSESGEVESYELVSQKTSLGIEEAFEEAFKETLEFEPIPLDDPPGKIQCEVAFPIQQ